MGRYLRKCRAMAAGVALLDAPTPLTRSRALSHLPPNPPPRPQPTKLRPRKPPSRKSTAAPPSSSSSSSSTSSNSPPAVAPADRIRTGASEAPATSCSSNGSCELAVEVGESFEAAPGLLSIPSWSGTRGGKELDTAATSTPPPEPKRRRRGEVAPRMPSGEEIEEFFSEAEKRERKRFADKYNFDVEKDIPLEGRYEWVRLIPEPLQQRQQVQLPPL